LARLSLLLACMTLAGACLVDDPPAYVAPKQTRPFFDYSHANPPLSEIIQAKGGDKISFRMPVVSEDAGDKLEAQMMQDGAGGPHKSEHYIPLPPSTLDDTSRVFNIDWTVVSSAPGCQRFTLRATPYGNISIEMGGDQIIDPRDTAEATWWANVDVDPLNAKMLVDCPSADRGTP